MAEIVNLNRARKAKTRASKALQAASNREKFGRSKADKAAEGTEAERRRRALDGAEREQ